MGDECGKNEDLFFVGKYNFVEQKLVSAILISMLKQETPDCMNSSMNDDCIDMHYRRLILYLNMST